MDTLHSPMPVMLAPPAALQAPAAPAQAAPAAGLPAAVFAPPVGMPPAAAGHSHAAGSTSLLLPNTLPPCNLPTETLNAKYGLRDTNPELASMQSWQQEQQDLMQFYSKDIQLDRETASINPRTRHNLLVILNLFVGYCCKYAACCQPALSCCLQPDMVAAFMAFCLARQNSHGTVQQYLHALLMVQTYLATRESSQQLRDQIQGVRPCCRCCS